MRAAFVLCLIVAACGRGTGEPPSAPRLVSLTPSATEVVAALDATELLVGVDDFSKYPPGVERLPKVGSFMQPSLEAIVRLRPTLVIVDDVHGTTASGLRSAGIATVECAMHALPDVKTALRVVGDRLGRRAEADRAVAGIDRAIDDAAAHRPAKHPRVLAVIDREAGGLGNLVAAGPGSYLDELLAIVGGDNVLAGSAVRYPKIAIEEVLRARPDVILDVSFAAKTEVAAWTTLGLPSRVVALDAPVLQGPVPRVAEALAIVAKAITN